jgi:DNA-binding CsgD family transcriptional regulator/PAS domain-containing protein
VRRSGASWLAWHARRLGFKVVATVALIQLLIFSLAGLAYLVRSEASAEGEAARRVLAPGRLIQSGQLPYAAMSDATAMREVVGESLVDALLVGANGNVFHAIDPTRLGRQVTELTDVDPEWFRSVADQPLAFHGTADGRSFLVGITPLMALDNIAPFLYAYVRIDTTVLERQKHDTRAVVMIAVAFGVVMTTLILWTAFESILLRRIRGTVQFLGQASADSIDIRLQAGSHDELAVVQHGLQHIVADRQAEKKRRTEIEAVLVESQAKEAEYAAIARSAQAEVQQAKSLIEAVPSGLLSIDDAGILLTCNDSASRRLRLPVEAILGRRLSEFLRVDGAAPGAEWAPGTHHGRLIGADGDSAVEIVVGRPENGDKHRVVLIHDGGDVDLRREVGALADAIDHSVGLTAGQQRSLSERLAMLRQYVIDLEMERRLASTALDRVPIAVAVVDRTASVRHLNQLAEKIVAANDGLRVLRGRLSATRREDQDKLQQRLADVLKDPSDPTALPWAAMRIERESGMAWLLRLSPLDRIGPQRIGTTGFSDLVIILMTDPDLPVKPSTALLRQLHGLTFAEAEVLGRLTAGLRLAEIGDDLGISIETVRSHLKAIFAKTGTSRQADLVRHTILGGAWFQDEAGAGDAPKLTRR